MESHDEKSSDVMSPAYMPRYHTAPMVPSDAIPSRTDVRLSASSGCVGVSLGEAASLERVQSRALLVRGHSGRFGGAGRVQAVARHEAGSPACIDADDSREARKKSPMT